MAHKASGKRRRKGLSLIKICKMFSDDKTAEKWFVKRRWKGRPTGPRCESTRVQSGAKHKTMPFREPDCDKRFSVKTGACMEASNLGYQTWAIAIYLMHTNNKGISSLRLHRELDVAQRTAWHLAHRIRESWTLSNWPKFLGPVEVDETYIGGKERNKHADKKSDGMRKQAFRHYPI
ncbi:MAG: hypothetical protein ISN28_16250 [Ectothiorhodospiraceae bacterium AqS1]|nr:hypothetical protein [Ectothiorhodospiraceae bacterium AqS1]MBF2761786.1 hypothetical protein [Ectothiorhodospiraceae bacterium AqS1]